MVRSATAVIVLAMGIVWGATNLVVEAGTKLLFESVSAALFLLAGLSFWLDARTGRGQQVSA